MPNIVTITRPDVIALIEKLAKKLARGNKTEAIAPATRRLLDEDARAGSLFGAHRGSDQIREGVGTDRADPRYRAGCCYWSRNRAVPAPSSLRAHSSPMTMNLINIIAAVIGAAVLERYPNLRIGLGESGIGWLPYALDRMDFEYEDRFRDLMKLKPSEYWRRQCRATFQFDWRSAPSLSTISGSKR
jgi:hypothetical protein